jgi:hypothetical protein
VKKQMRGRAHVYMARELSKRLGLSKELEKVFANAIVEPDRWRRKNPRRRHHYSQPYMALEYIKKARRAYVKGDAPRASETWASRYTSSKTPSSPPLGRGG